MDEDLAKIIRRALNEAKAAGRDHTAQTDYAVKKVLELRHDMTASDALNANELVAFCARVGPARRPPTVEIKTTLSGSIE